MQAESTVPTEPTTMEKLRGLKWSIASNAANTVMVQYTFFGSVFVLFLNALGLSKSQMGFLLSLLPFFGLIALFVAPTVERFGYKRTYVTFFGLRALVAAGLLVTPTIVAQFGPDTTLIFVAAIIALFSMVRSIGVTASFPWVQQYVPNNVRGKYTATNNIFTTITGFIAVTIGGIILNRMAGLSGFMLLLAVGVLFGFISVSFALLIPGGAPRPRAQGAAKQRDLGVAIRDRQFVSYLIGVGLLTLVTVPLASFLPLFMREQVGLSASAVVLLQTGTLAGTLASSYVWGWAADRYGSMPVTLYGLGLRLLLPLMWMIMPRHSDLSLPFALGIAFTQGVADMGWGIGSGRLLYVSIVPTDKRSDYMALYYAWTGIIGGISQLSGGYILQATQNISGQFWVFTLDPFIPLFLAGLTLPIFSILLLRRIHEDRGVGVGEFAGIFLRGNPFLAMTSMIRYHLAKDEHSAVLMTERLGEAKSPLTVEELLEALEDPRFNVRFEAIVSIARMPPDHRLIDALISILEGSELALTVVAAWALGRLGDSYAVPALRRALNSDYRSVRVHAARALGALDAREVAPELIARLQAEDDKGLQMAYASALGNLKAVEGVPVLLRLLDAAENPGARLELALTLSRIVGEEAGFVNLLRQSRSDPGTAMAQAVTTFSRRQDKHTLAPVQEALDKCEAALARGDLARGSHRLSDAIDLLPFAKQAIPAATAQTHALDAIPQSVSQAQGLVLAECARQLHQHGGERMEYLLLALHVLSRLRLSKK